MTKTIKTSKPKNKPKKVVQTMTARLQYFFKVGNRFGYPVCCIEAFIKDVEELDATGKIASRENSGLREKWSLHGFVPCEKHAQFIEREGYAVMVDKINKNRKFPYLFPMDEQLIGELIMGFLNAGKRDILNAALRPHTND